jgi:hypothetical protein
MKAQETSEHLQKQAMLQAEIRWLTNGPILKLEGKLDGRWAEQARCLIPNDFVPEGLIVDLTKVTYVDLGGEHLLKCLRRLGAEFVARGFYAQSVCQRLGISTLERAARRRTGRHRKGLHNEVMV